jgi:PAS domain S-box-containing protein
VRLVSSERDGIVPILAYDEINGQRVECPVANLVQELTPITRKVLEQGAQLVGADGTRGEIPTLTTFGDTSRRSASRMFAPIRKGATQLGILSIYSYRANAYIREDLQLLQALADHCAGALMRINIAESLRESEEQFRSLFESAPFGLALHDAKGHFISTNRAYQEMLGYSGEELKRLGVKGVTHPEDIPEGQRLFSELAASQRNVYRRKKRYLRRDGRVSLEVVDVGLEGERGRRSACRPP